MKAILLLADAAQESGGKLFILGGGWSISHGVGPFAMALAIKFEVPWNDTNRKHAMVAELLDQDGKPATPIGAPSPLRIEGVLEAGRPPGLPPGTPIDAPLAINIGGVQLAPGGYRWQITVNKEVVAEASFLVRAQEEPSAPKR